jgi:thioredoxin reductase
MTDDADGAPTRADRPRRGSEGVTGEEATGGGVDYDVVVVGGGPAGCSAGVFTARYGLDTVVFDRGRSSIRRCAHLENYLGFPAGIDVDTFHTLALDHAAEAGCEIDADLVESVERVERGDGAREGGDRADDGRGRDGPDADREGGDAGPDARFVVETQEGRRVSARWVVAATRYGGEYLRPLGDGSMFETLEHDGEEHERFARSYAGADGETPVEGLFVASPSAEADRQAIVAAGRGARVGLALVEELRRRRGIPDSVADHHDWRRRDAERDPELRDRDRWRELIESALPDDVDFDDERAVELREREIDRRMDSYLTDEEIATRRARGQRRLLERLDDERVLERAREIRGETGRESAGGG